LGNPSKREALNFSRDKESVKLFMLQPTIAPRVSVSKPL